jgi:hypothetical protein
MTPSLERVDTEIDREHLLDSHEIMYLVKRPMYEFYLTVPRGGANGEGNGRPSLQVRFKDQSQVPGLVLEIDEMEDFYEGLSRLMEYVCAEKAKRQEQL